MPLFVIKLLVVWYSQQLMNIRWGNTVSSSFHVTNGVKQGGIISPVLFNVYMDDLSTSLNNSGIGGHIGEKTINHLCYADDICLIALSSSAMQQLLNICHTYSTEHSLLYTGNKSFSLCFKPSTVKFTRPWFFLASMKIPIVTHCKYLDVIMSEHNSDNDLKRQKFYANANILIRKFSKCSVNVKCYLFKTYCSTMYCSALWFNSTKTALLTKLKIAYNNSLRRLLGLPKYNSASEMFVNLGILSFGELLRKFVFSLKCLIIHVCRVYTIPLFF